MCKIIQAIVSASHLSCDWIGSLNALELNKYCEEKKKLKIAVTEYVQPFAQSPYIKKDERKQNNYKHQALQ